MAGRVGNGRRIRIPRGRIGGALVGVSKNGHLGGRNRGQKVKISKMLIRAEMHRWCSGKTSTFCRRGGGGFDSHSTFLCI
jgi:hypothetical protein